MFPQPFQARVRLTKSTRVNGSASPASFDLALSAGVAVGPVGRQLHLVGFLLVDEEYLLFGD